jgi:hypothetical protein
MPAKRGPAKDRTLFECWSSLDAAWLYLNGCMLLRTYVTRNGTPHYVFDNRDGRA